MDHEQLQLAPDLLDVMRDGVSIAIANGAQFVAPPHLLLALLKDPRVGPAIDPFIRRNRLERAVAEASKKLPGVLEVPEGALPDGEHAPFARYDTFAFRSVDGARTLYLDGDAYHLFIEGAQRAQDVYHPKHLVMGFTAESVKDQDLLAIVGPDPAGVTAAVVEL